MAAAWAARTSPFTAQAQPAREAAAAAAVDPYVSVESGDADEAAIGWAGVGRLSAFSSERPAQL